MADAAALVEIVGKESVSGPAGIAAGALSAVEAAAGKTGSAFASLASSVVKTAAAVATLSATGIIAGLTAATTAAAGFEKQMSAVGAVSGASAQQMKDLSALALKLGADTSFSASESAQGIGELVKAGVSIADVMGGAAKASLDLAAAGGVDVATAAEIASNAMNVFSIKGKDMAHVADEIAGAANASAIDVNDYKFSLSAAGAVAATVGINFDDLSTAIAVMGQAGVKGSDAGTSLKTMLLNLTPSTKAQIAEAKELGIVTADGANKFFDASGKAKSMAEIAGVLQNATKDLTEQQRLQALQTLFGTDAVRAAAIMARAGAGGFNEMATAIGKVSASDVANTRLDNLAGSIEKFKGSAETASITVGQHLTPPLRRLVDIATDLVNKSLPTLDRFGTVLGTTFDHLIDRAQHLVPHLGALRDILDGIGARAGQGLEAARQGISQLVTEFEKLIEVVRPTVVTLLDMGRTAGPMVQQFAAMALPVLKMVGQYLMDYVINQVQFLTTYVLPAFYDAAVETFGFFRDVGPTLAHIAGVLHEQLGVTLIWLADEAWPNLLSIVRQTVEWFDRELLPLIPGIADALRVNLGGALYWLATTGWPAMLDAASAVITWVTGTAVPAITSLVGWLMDKAPAALSALSAAWESVRAVVGPIIDDLFSGRWADALGKMGAAFSDLAGKVTGWLGEQIAKVDWSAVWSQAKDVLATAASWFADAAVRFAGWIGEQVGKIDWASVWAVAKDVTIKMAGWFADVATRFGGWVGDQVAVIDWGSVWNQAKDVALSMGQWFADVAVRFAGWIGDKVAEIDWAAVWAKAVDVVTNMAQWFTDTATQFAAWIGEKVALIDWASVWLNVKDMAAAMQASFAAEAAKIDWKAVLAAATDAAIQMFTWLTDTIKSIDWAKLGESTGVWLGGMFKQAGEDTDWKAVGTTFATLIGSMLGAAVSSMEAWASFKQALMDGFYKSVLGISMTDAQTALGNKFVDMLKGAWNWATGRWAPSLSFGSGSGGGSASTNQPIAGQSLSSSGNGQIDNSSKQSFVRTAYSAALEAANGDPNLANQLLAIALSENGAIGSGADLGATMGFNFAGVHAQPGEASFMATDAGRPTAFKKYGSLSEGLHGFMDFLQQNPRYAAALATYAQTRDVDRLTGDVNAAGYSETPDWQDRIRGIRQTTVEPITSDAAVSAAGSATRTSGRTSMNLNTSTFAIGNQFELGLPRDEAMAACGPAAVAIFEQMMGRTPNAQEVMQIAAKNGWTAAAGMGGPQAFMNTLTDLAIEASADYTPTQQEAASAVSSGHGVAFSTAGGAGHPLSEGHYFVAQGYNADTGTFDFGETAGPDPNNASAGHALRGGSRYMTYDEVVAMAGPVQALITLMDGVPAAADTASGALADVGGAAKDAGPAISSLATTAATAAADTGRRFQILAADSQVDISEMADGLVTQITDAAGNVTSTVTDMNGNVVRQFASMADGTLIATGNMGTSLVESLDQTSGLIDTTMTDAAGNVVETVTDMAGTVLLQTATMADTAGASFGAVGTAATNTVAPLDAFSRTIGTLPTPNLQPTADQFGIAEKAADDARQAAEEYASYLSDIDNFDWDAATNSKKPREYTPASSDNHRAGGGPVWPGTWLVGEEGPELLTLGSGQYGGISNNRDTRRALGGGNDGGIDHDALAKAIARELAGVLPNRGDVNVYGAGTEEVAQKVIRHLRRENSMTGVRR